MNSKSGLMWSTYGGDIEWFKRSARSYSKFATGFHAAKCVVPKQDEHLFVEICRENGIFLSPFEEWPGKGFLHHMAMTMYGDLHFPEADFIFHVDSDTVFASPCSPEDWLPSGKVLQPFLDFSTILTRPLKENEMQSFMGFTGKAFDLSLGQYMWKFTADFALGWPVERACMTWMPMVHIREVYSKAREIISNRFPDLGFEGYVRKGRNEFPQQFCEFETLGAVAYKFFQDRYHWHNISTSGYPFAGKVIQSWSHGGLDRPHDFAIEVGGLQTPRQLFERLGLE